MVVPQSRPAYTTSRWKAASLSVARNSNAALLLHIASMLAKREETGGMANESGACCRPPTGTRSHCQIGMATPGAASGVRRHVQNADGWLFSVLSSCCTLNMQVERENRRHRTNQVRSWSLTRTTSHCQIGRHACFTDC